MEEYVCKFLEGDPHRWASNEQWGELVSQAVRIVYTFREHMVTFQGNLLKARTMLQIPQRRGEVEAGKREKMRVRKCTKNKATQTSWLPVSEKRGENNTLIER